MRDTLRRTICLLMLVAAAVPLFAQEAEAPPSPLLEIGAAWSPALTLFSRYFIVSVAPVGLSLNLRWADLVETSVRVEPLFGKNLSGPPLLGLEIALSPRAGAYSPVLGLGVLFGWVNSFYMDIPLTEGEFTVYAVCAPLRWSWRINAGGEAAARGHTVFLSFLELRYGSLLNLGGHPAFERLGSFYFSAVPVSVGFFAAVLEKAR